MTLIFPAAADAPIATRKPTKATHHGRTRQDDYGWLRADNWQDAMRDPSQLPAEISAYLNAENAYQARAMADTKALQDSLVAEMRGRMMEDDANVPILVGPYQYNNVVVAGGEHFKLVRAPREGGPEVVVLDLDQEASNHDYFVIGAIKVSPDHRHIAWSADTTGSELFALRLRDTTTGQDSETVIRDVDSVAWGDAQTLFYTRVDADHRPKEVFRHRLGTDPADDVLVYTETDPRYFTSVRETLSRAFVLISTGMNDESEILTIPATDLTAEPRVVCPRAAGIEYDVEHDGSQFIISTNYEAQDFKLVTAPDTATSRDDWVDLVPHRPGHQIVLYWVTASHLMWCERADALPRIRILRHGEPLTAAQDIAFDEEAYALALNPPSEFDSPTLRFEYFSPTTPRQVFDYDLTTGERVLRKADVIRSGHDPADYVTRRLMAPSHDGELVPVTVLHHKDTAIDGSAPCYLYGYGSYGHSLPAGFSGHWLSLVNRGFVCAIAHVRGGEEKGRAWYEDAKFDRKINTFKDFIAVAEYLIDAGYTQKRRIVISGGSAGGLLVGAAANMAPDLWAGVIASVPFVDVLNTILDDSLPLTPSEWSQWGNPIESAAAYGDIAGYSPYDNVTAQDYPPILVTAGVSDPRVTYWEPAKWVAKLRATKTDNNVLMLKTNMTSGHFGKSGRFAALEDNALNYAFAMKCVGLA